MSDIVLSSAVRSNLLALQSTAKLMATTQDRLATGKKVNSALDNPTNYFTAASLDSRANDLNTLLDSVSNGVQALKAADTGITSLQKLVDSAKSTARQALQSSAAYTTKASLASGSNLTGTLSASNILGGTYSNNSVTGSAVQDNASPAANITGSTLLNALGSAVTTADTLTVNGTSITFTTAGTGQQDATHVRLDDSVSSLLGKIDAITGASTSSSVAAGKVTLNTGTASDLTLAGSVLTKLGLSAGTTSRTLSGSLSGQTLSVQVGSGTNAQTANVTFGTGAGQVSTLDQLNTALNAAGAQASLDSAGHLAITTTNESGAEAVTLSGTSTGAGKAFTSTSASATLGGTGQTDRNNLVTDYNNLLGQIDKLAQDASFNGVNLLNGDNLTVIFNEKSTSKLTIQGVTFNSSGLGLASVSNSDFADSTSINAVLDKLSSATSTLRSQASKFGSNLSVVQTRQDFSKSLINVLQQGSANLTLADVNEEGANMTALQTRQSLSVTALSLANQAQQAVLRLF